MSIFKNEVGRPSNETLKKRKIIIGGGVAFAVLFVFGLILLLGNGSESGNLTARVSRTTGSSEDSKLVISSRKVGSGFFKQRQYYIDYDKSVNISSDKNLFEWYMTPALSGTRQASAYNYDYVNPARFLASYFCYARDIYGNRIKSNSITYLGF